METLQARGLGQWDTGDKLSTDERGRERGKGQRSWKQVTHAYSMCFQWPAVSV